MRISMNEMLFALSTALDCVESEVFGVSTHHSKRVAYISVEMGRVFGFAGNQLAELAGSAVMHDNALTEYIAARRLRGYMNNTKKDIDVPQLGIHCEMGEENMKSIPFYGSVKGAVLYHHENADGSGPFGRKPKETPVYAQIIHIADQIDNGFNLREFSPESYRKLIFWLRDNRRILFSDECVNAFIRALPYEKLAGMQEENIVPVLEKSIPYYNPDYDREVIEALSGVFAKITDFKSHFTSMHSQGIAEKAEIMGRYYGDTEENCIKLYLAGALHDIGKLTISNNILEKPDKLTTEEFEIMKGHAVASYEILKGLTDIPDVVSWAVMHHEKLDGSGYPFGKTAEELGKYERLLCCLDIFQALSEDRPYKKGMSYARSLDIMREMVQAGKIDAGITEDIGRCFPSDTEQSAVNKKQPAVS